MEFRDRWLRDVPDLWAARGMKKMDVMFYEAFEEEEKALKKYLAPHINAGFTWKTIQESGDVKPPSKLISIRTQSVIPAKWQDDLKGILSRSTGFDHIESINKKIPCGYLPLYCKRAVAEHAILLILSLIRKLPLQMKQCKKFKRDGITGMECENKTMLVVGVGNIGSEIIRLGTGLGMNVFGVDLVKKYDFVKYVDINKYISKSNIIVCAMNLTKENNNFFNYELLRKAMPGVIFINIARGEMAPPKDLLRLQKDNHFGGIGLDVYAEESTLAVALRKKEKIIDENIKATLKLSRYGNVICTPHNAFNTIESVDKKAKDSMKQIENFLTSNEFLWSV